MKLFSIRIEQMKIMIVVARDENAARAIAMRELFLPGALDIVHAPSMTVLELGTAMDCLPEGVFIHGDCMRIYVRPDDVDAGDAKVPCPGEALWTTGEGSNIEGSGALG